MSFGFSVADPRNFREGIALLRALTDLAISEIRASMSNAGITNTTTYGYCLRALPIGKSPFSPNSRSTGVPGEADFRTTNLDWPTVTLGRHTA